jgi:hypothetical protein
MKSTTRIYLITTPTGKRLVDAANKTQAVNHVAKATITATVASQSELVKLTKDGIEVETAGSEGE